MRSIFGISLVRSAHSAGPSFFSIAIVGSLLLHLLVIYLLMDGTPRELAEFEETPIEVELVPPPEEEAEQEQEQEEEVAQQEEAEQTETQEPPPAPEAPQAQEEVADLSSPIPVFRPVIEFAEEDGGSQETPDGTAREQPAETESQEEAQSQSAESDNLQSGEEGAVEEAAEPDTETSGTQEEIETADDTAEDPGATPDQETAESPEAVEQAAEPAESVEEATESESESNAVATLVTPVKKPARRPSSSVQARLDNAPAPRSNGPTGPLKEARELFSEQTLLDPRVRTRMAGMPRDMRANFLCSTELRNQLLDAGKSPELLPVFPFPDGTVLQASDAFRNRLGLWYEVSFRCEMNRSITKIVRFSYRVGRAIPRSEWARRGLNSF